MFEKMKEYWLYVILGLIALWSLWFVYLSIVNNKSWSDIELNNTNAITKSINRSEKIKNNSTIAQEILSLNWWKRVWWYLIDTQRINYVIWETYEDIIDNKQLIDIADSLETWDGVLRITLISQPALTIQWKEDVKVVYLNRDDSIIVWEDIIIKSQLNQVNDYLKWYNISAIWFWMFENEQDAKDFRDTYFNNYVIYQVWTSWKYVILNDYNTVNQNSNNQIIPITLNITEELIIPEEVFPDPEPLVQNSNWTIVHNFRNKTIEITYTWTNTSLQQYFEISDRNLWATKYFWEEWAELEETYWFFYQWWNNYWFPSSWPVDFSESSVNFTWTDYWPWTTNWYYINSTFVKNQSRWATWTNSDLWWDTTNTLEARRWPCPVWYHIPTQTEADNLFQTFKWIMWNTRKNYTQDKLLIPFVWNIDNDWTISWQWYQDKWFARFWTSSYIIWWKAYQINVDSTWDIKTTNTNSITLWRSLRCFKN